jgi:hypothetical protein
MDCAGFMRRSDDCAVARLQRPGRNEIQGAIRRFFLGPREVVFGDSEPKYHSRAAWASEAFTANLTHESDQFRRRTHPPNTFDASPHLVLRA